jgi:hypothetical protein
MKQFATRVEYLDAIAKAMGLGGSDDLAAEHRAMLQVERFERLPIILHMVETAAGQQDALLFAEDDHETLAAKVVAVNRVLLEHHDSKIKAVQELVAKLDAILDGEGDEDASFPQS